MIGGRQCRSALTGARSAWLNRPGPEASTANVENDGTGSVWLI